MASKADTYRELMETARAAWPGRIAIGPGSMEVSGAGHLLVHGTSSQVILTQQQAVELGKWLLERFTDNEGDADESE